jgi:glycosyltransferase involved in cell wall biosynthesis
MRVLHINNEKNWRGGERQTLLTALEQHRQHLDSSIACRRGSPLGTMAAAQAIPVFNLPIVAPAALAKLIQLTRAFDLLHCHSARAHSLAALATLIHKKPLVVSRRVDFVPKNNWFNRFKYRRASKVVCVSHFVANLMREQGLSTEHLVVIHDAVPDEALPPKEVCLQQLRAKAALPAGKRIVGNIAALVPHKDHATLLRAAQSVAAQRDDVIFVVIGEGELRADLLRLRAELRLEKTVYFTGFIPQAQQLLPAFDVFAMSSCMEGLGSIVLEAGMAGIPVAATAGGGLPEIVEDNQTGLLVPVGDAPALANAILRLLSDPLLAVRLAESARSRVRAEFSVAHMTRKYVAVYQEVLGRAGQSGARRI